MESKDKGYANSVIRNPLIQTGESLRIQKYELALESERVIILSLHPEWKEEFKEDILAIEYLLTQADLIRELDPVQYEIIRRAYFKKIGSKVALKIYDKLWTFANLKSLFGDLTLNERRRK